MKWHQMVSALVLINRVIAVVSFAVMVVACLAQVFFRYFLNLPLAWTDELSRFSFVWVVFFGGALGVFHGVHLGVDFLIKQFKPLMKNTVSLLMQFVLLLLVAVVIKESFVVSVFNMQQTSSSLQIPMGIPYLAIPISFTLIFIYLLNTLFNTVMPFFNKKNATESRLGYGGEK